jgi:glycosyltransferase involved in cell wall biosynthesis
MENKNFNKLSIIIPVYNEKGTINKILELIEKASVFSLGKEIILVDDFSTDGSREILSEAMGKHKVILKKKNEGKGSTLRDGFSASTGDIIIIQDADLEYNPDEYQYLLKPILDGKADVVYGSRFMGGMPHRVLYYWHYVGNKFLTRISNMLTNLNLTDMESCYKVFTREIIEEIHPKLKSKRFGFEPEVTAYVGKLAKKNKCRVYEVGISYSGRTYEEGKKIGWKDGIEAVWCIIKYNLFSKF